MAYTAIDDPEKYFQVKLYAGDSTNHALTFDGDSDMSPNWVLIKERDGTINYYNFDSVRGVGKRLQPNINAAEDDTDSTWFQSFDSDGFSIGSEDNINDTGDNYVAWCWKESATAGFDIVLYTGNATARTISHNLSAIPKMIIVKTRSTDDYNWIVYHGANTSAPETDAIFLNTTDDTDDDATYWNDTAPTSSVFTVGTSGYSNKNTDNMLAYVFAEKQGFSKFGSYTGNSDNDGMFVYTGFKPAFVMTKASENTSGSNNWFMADNKRHSVAPASGGTNFNVIDRQLYANLNNADDTNSSIDFLSNGFKWRRDGGDTNATGRTFVYMAFAEAPFVNSNGVPCNAR